MSVDWMLNFGLYAYKQNTLANNFVGFVLFVLICFNFETDFSQPILAQADLELVTSLPWPLKSWENRPVPPYSSVLSQILRVVLN